MKFINWIVILLMLVPGCTKEEEVVGVTTTVLSLKNEEDSRPSVHFTPLKNWMNDPNGLVYYKGEYHLFYQYHPGGNKWGPMHWGHAISTDLFNWKDMPIALFPDANGAVFSGSVVVDSANTAGFKTGTESPMVAVYTSAGDRQSQSIAYSNDKGRTWVKYLKNPVLPNPGINDFRDPKVFWNAATANWIMSLATGHEISFYSSSNLKEWKFESAFGKGMGAQGGVWECPDLFPVRIDNTTEIKWVLLVSLNPGGPNGGSATQYFVGNFDGKKFTPDDTTISWVDYGTDNYAGVTFANIPPTDGRRISIGWMSNWVYAELVPTTTWRSTMTLPRELRLTKTDNRYKLVSSPVSELNKYIVGLENIDVRNNQDVLNQSAIVSGSYVLGFTADFSTNDTLSVTFGNPVEKLTLLFDVKNNMVSIDRSKSGPNAFHPFFNNTIRAELGRIADNSTFDVKVIVDKTSVELFWNSGRQVMSALFFSSYKYNQLRFNWNSNRNIVSQVQLGTLKKSLRND